jgi:hypothetical protein
MFNIFGVPAQAYQEAVAAPRILAPQKRRYPVLERFERLLYPGKNFSSEDPNKRLERIEIAVFGNTSQGRSIKERVQSLESELASWQIADSTEIHALPIAPRPPRYYQSRAKIDYQYQNYRMAMPLIQNIGRRSINAIFKSAQ